MTAVVELRPDLERFRKEAERGVAQAADKAGKGMEDGLENSGKKAGKKAGKGIGDGIDSGTGDGTKRADRHISGLGDRFRKLEGVGRSMTLGVTTPIVGGFALATKNASDLNEAVNATQTVYGAASKDVIAFSKTAIDTIGISQGHSLAMMNQIGAQMVAQGMSADKAAAMSIDLLKRGRDIKSLLNASSTEEVMTAISAGLRGESEPLRRFGVAISEVALQAEALRLGIVRAAGDPTKIQQAQLTLSKAQEAYAKTQKDSKATEQDRAQALSAVQIAEAKLAAATEGKLPQLSAEQKMQAAYSLTMRQSALAEGDYAKTKNSVANASETAKERFTELTATLGTQLMPIATQLLTWANKILEKFNHLSPDTQKVVLAIAALAAVIGPLILVGSKVVTAISAIRSAMIALNAVTMANPWVLLIAALVAVGVIIYKNRKAIGEWLRGVGASMAGLGRVLVQPFQKLWDFTKLVFGGIVAGAKGIANAWIKGWELMINGAVKGANLLIRGVNILNPGKDVPYLREVRLPKLAEGGNVVAPGAVMVGERGPEILSLPAGARVTPLDKAAPATSAAGASTNVYMEVTVNGAEMSASALARELDRISRDAAAATLRTRRYR